MPTALQKKRTAGTTKTKAKVKIKKRILKVPRHMMAKAKAQKKPAVKRRAATPVRRKPAMPKRVPVVSPATHGKVVHYYDRIGVAIVEVHHPFALGDFVRVRSGTTEFIQPVTSLQVEHAPVARAERGQVVGLRVSHPVPEGAMLLPM